MSGPAWRVRTYSAECDRDRPSALRWQVTLWLTTEQGGRKRLVGAGNTWKRAYRDALGVAGEMGLVLEMEADDGAAGAEQGRAVAR